MVVGTPGSFTVSATGFPAPTFSEIGTLPTGVSLNSNTGVLNGTPTAGTGGTYSITITAHNGVGTDASQGFALTINEAPTITSPNNTTATVNSSGKGHVAQTFNVTASGFPAATFSETGALPAGVSFDSASGVLTESPAIGTGGTYPIVFSAQNGVGTVATQNFTLYIDEQPTITSASSTTFTVGGSGSYTVTATGFPAPTFSETGLLPTGVTLNSSTGALTGTPATGTAGIYNLVLTAHNAIGADATQSFTLTVNQATAITSANATTFLAGALGSFAVTATGYPTPSLSESGTLPSGVTFNTTTGQLSGTPGPSTGGTYGIAFTAHNGVGGDATQSFTLTVTQPVAITSAASTTFTTGTVGSFSLIATGFPVPTLSESGSLPTGVSFNAGTGLLSGAPNPGTGGIYNITFTAHNGIGSDVIQSFTLTVNQAPAITSGSSTAFTIGSPGSFSVTDTGYPLPTLSESGSLPTGVTFNPSTGQLSGTPASASSGIYVFNLTAHNGAGTDATQNFTLTINKIASTATLSVAPNPSTYGSSVTFTATVSPTAATGTVQFMDGSNSLGSPVSLASVGGTPTATLTTSTLTGGNHTISAVYSGDANDSGSTSNPVTQVVNKLASSSTLTSAAATSVAGSKVTLTATVSPLASTGTVQFQDGGANLGSPVALSLVNGVPTATLATTSLLVSGNHSITAVYSGDTNDAGSSSNSITQAVTYIDLTVNSAQIDSSSTLSSGGQVKVDWNDQDSGTATVNGAFYDYVLVQKVNSDNSLTTIASGTVIANSALAAGSTSAQSYTFTLPDGAAGTGTLKVTITADYYTSIQEYDASGSPAYGNNTSTINATTSLAAYADLSVPSSSLTISPSTPQSGNQATVTWNDQNVGTGPATSAFSDYVLVQKVNTDHSLTYIASSTLNGNSGLSASAVSGQSFSFVLPNGTPGVGDIRVTVTTDSGATVKEFDSSGNAAFGNNTTTTDVTSQLAPSPDLVVQGIVVNNGSTSPVLPGQTIPVSWTDVNQGSVAASGTWTDEIFLADDAAGTANLTPLTSITGSGPLTATSGNLAQATTITIPATVVGAKTIVVETGVNESFFEYNTANDTSVSAAAVTVPPSLQVSLAAPGNPTFNKNATSPASSATVTRNDTNVGALTVTVTSSNPGHVLLSATPSGTASASIQVTIPNGVYSALFYVDAFQDGIVDGTETASITPTATSYVSIAGTATELETNQPALSLSLSSNTFDETAGTTATLTRNTNASSANDGAVTVHIFSSDAAVATAPTTVTIPAGQSSVSFAVSGVPTSLLVAGRKVILTTDSPIDPVTGSSFSATSVAATVTHSNNPVLTLVPNSSTIEENATNPATYAVLSLTDAHGNLVAASAAITVDLFSSDTADLTVPSTVVVPQGSTSVNVPLTVVNNPNNTNPSVTVTAYTTDAITHQMIATGSASASVVVLSTNGATLAVSTPVSYISLSGQTTATVARTNADMSQPLTVNLTSSNPSEAVVPAQVTIPAGQATATFAVTGVNNGSGQSGGSVPVTIEASVGSLNSGAETISVVTSALADLVLTSITSPNNPLTNQSNVTVHWQVTNAGNVAATGSWIDHFVLSSSAQGTNVLYTQDVPYSGGSLAVGASYTASATFTVPGSVGTYYLSVATNSGATPIQEITVSNDKLVSSMAVNSAYGSTLTAGVGQAAAGTAVPLSGVATNADGSVAANKAIYVAIQVNSKPNGQIGPITTDSSGHWSTTYRPSSAVPGSYQFAALTNGMTQNTNSNAIATVDLDGLVATPSPIALSLVPGTAVGGTITLSNLSGLAGDPLATLTNLTYTVNEGTGSQAYQLLSK